MAAKPFRLANTVRRSSASNSMPGRRLVRLARRVDPSMLLELQFRMCIFGGRARHEVRRTLVRKYGGSGELSLLEVSVAARAGQPMRQIRWRGEQSPTARGRTPA